MSENKKVALGLGKGVLTLICVLVWYGENERVGGHWGGARAAGPLCGLPLQVPSSQTVTFFGPLAFRSQPLGCFIVE